jgi:transcriptional regulator with XRE-family HTH domain
MAVDIPVIREVVERVCTRPDVLDACKRRDLGFVVRVLCAYGITQGQIAALTGITQGRLSEYKTGKRIATATSTFEAFADGLELPAVARCALGLASEAAGSGPSDQAGGRSANIVGASSGDVQPLLSNLSRASAVPVLSALREIHRGYVEADRLMGSICITGPISLQMSVVERVCEVTRGPDRAEMLRFACQFTEFGGWVFQDAADLVCAMHWTDRALAYALELGDQRVIAYTLMRKAMIATESSNPAQGGLCKTFLKEVEPGCSVE